VEAQAAAGELVSHTLRVELELLGRVTMAVLVQITLTAVGGAAEVQVLLADQRHFLALQLATVAQVLLIQLLVRQ